MIKIITKEEDFIALKPVWNNIYDECSYVTPFQSYDYIRLSWDFCKSQATKLYILEVCHTNPSCIIALFPTCLGKKGNLTFVNAPYTDFCDAIISPQHDNYNLYQEVSDFIKKDKNIKYVDFYSLQSNSKLLSSFAPFFGSIYIDNINYYSKLNISPRNSDKDFIDSFTSLKAKGKKNLRKCKEGLDTLFEFKLFSKKNGNLYPEHEIKVLVDYMISNKMRSKDYLSDNLLQFIKGLYASELLTISLSIHKNEVKSCNFIFFDAKNNEYIKWIMIYKNSLWNMSSNLYLANHIYNQGGGIINFARGIYDYKMTNFHPDVYTLYHMCIFKKNIPFFNYWLRQNGKIAKRIIKNLIHKAV